MLCSSVASLHYRLVLVSGSGHLLRSKSSAREEVLIGGDVLVLESRHGGWLWFRWWRSDFRARVQIDFQFLDLPVGLVILSRGYWTVSQMVSCSGSVASEETTVGGGGWFAGPLRRRGGALLLCSSQVSSVVLLTQRRAVDCCMQEGWYTVLFPVH